MQKEWYLKLYGFENEEEFLKSISLMQVGI